VRRRVEYYEEETIVTQKGDLSNAKMGSGKRKKWGPS
jgi:hypothetical protein